MVRKKEVKILFRIAPKPTILKVKPLDKIIYWIADPKSALILGSK